MSWLPIISCALLVSLCLFAEAKGRADLAGVAKLGASASFLGLALLAGAFGSLPGQIIFAGLLFSAFGDGLLISSRKSYILGGMGAFGVAHLTYLAGFLARGFPTGLPAVIGIGSTLLIILPALLWLRPQLLTQWKGPATVYGGVIGLMVAAAIAGWGAGYLPLMMALGAVLFAVSDISVALDRLTGHDRRTRRLGLPLYYAAQLMIAGAL